MRLCGQQNIPLRVTHDWGKMDESTPLQNDGNFRSLLRVLKYGAATGDKDLSDSLNEGPRNAIYVSPGIQYSIIDSFGALIQSCIIQDVKKTKYFSIFADKTTDITQKEQFSLCVRFTFCAGV